MKTLQNFVGGDWIPAGEKTLPVENPATGEILAQVPLSHGADVDRAVAAAQAAFPAWRKTPPLTRTRYFFTLKNLLEEHAERLANILVQEHGKTLSEARGSVRRTIENVEVATGIPSLMQGTVLEDVALGIDCEAIRQPIGVFACIAPFNFPAMVPFWFLPYAVACGNTFIVKPSEQVPLCQEFIFGLMQAAGFPPGVVNLVHGAQETTEALLDHPGLAGVSFVGSTPVAKAVYRRSALAGKRVQALGGAKNFVVVLEDAHLPSTAEAITGSYAGCAGERCLAGSVVLAVDGIHNALVDGIKTRSQEIVLGHGLESGVTMGPVISRAHRDRIVAAIDGGVSEGAELILDGRDDAVPQYPHGHWLGPSIFTGASPEMAIAREEIFGPVLTVIRVADMEEALSIMAQSPFGNATSLFTQSGKAAREFRYRAEVSMIGINVGVPAPMATFTFGGIRDSFFGDLKAHGQDAIRFYTDTKTVMSRWP